jgi:hypothetical protein
MRGCGEANGHSRRMNYDVGGLIVIITVASTRLELPQTGLRAVRYRRPRSLNNQHQNLPLQSRSS